MRFSKLSSRLLPLLLIVAMLIPSHVSADVSAITSDSQEYTFTEDGTPFDVFFKSDGTKMYMLGYDNDTVYQYTLSSAWDVSSASYDSVSFSVNAQESVPEGLFFKPDGTKMYVVGVATDRVHQYSLSTPWDLSTASYDSKSSPSNSGNDATTVKAIFDSTGTYMFVLGFVTGRVFQYTLSTPWDVSTATYASVYYDTSAQTTNPYAFMIDSSGTRMLAVSPSDVIYQYNFSSAGDLSTVSYSGLSYNANSIDSSLYGLNLKSDDSKLFMVGAANNKVYTYSIDFGDLTAPEVSTISPADDATGIDVDTNLVLTFTEAVDAESGNIYIRRTSDNLLIESIDVTGGLVSGSGTTTITVNPSTTLSAETGYYIQIDATAFDDAASNSFSGIGDTTAWNFTTAAASGGGGDATSALRASVVTMLNPRGGETFTGGEEVEIEWSTSNYSNGNEVELSVSYDGGHSFELIDTVLGVDEYVWTVPNMETRSAMIMIELVESSNVAKAYTDFAFSIEESHEEEEETVEGDTETEEQEEENMLALPKFGPSPFTDEEQEITQGLEPGDLIVGESYSAVYLISEDGTRRPFPSETIYFTWYDDFEEVKDVTDATLAYLPLGTPVLPNPGTVLVKIPSVSSVYVVEEGGTGTQLRLIETEVLAESLFGEQWSEYVIDLSPALFPRFEMREAVDEHYSVDMDRMRSREDLGL